MKIPKIKLINCFTYILISLLGIVTIFLTESGKAKASKRVSVVIGKKQVNPIVPRGLCEMRTMTSTHYQVTFVRYKFTYLNLNYL